MDTKNLGDLYDLAPLDWNRIAARLDRGFTQAPGSGGPDHFTCWLATIDPDAAPHVTALGALWVGGAFWFTTSERSRKGRNLARDPRCTLSIATEEFDLTVEGEARQVTDPPTVAKLSAEWAASGWPCEPDESGAALTAPFSAPSAGPPPWHVYRIDARSATALGTVEDHSGATRWRF